MQEALSPAGVLGPEPLSLMPQRVPSEPAKRCFRAMAANPFFSTTWSMPPLSKRARKEHDFPTCLRLSPSVELFGFKPFKELNWGRVFTEPLLGLLANGLPDKTGKILWRKQNLDWQP